MGAWRDISWAPAWAEEIARPSTEPSHKTISQALQEILSTNGSVGYVLVILLP